VVYICADALSPRTVKHLFVVCDFTAVVFTVVCGWRCICMKNEANRKSENGCTQNCLVSDSVSVCISVNAPMGIGVS
jgi:hypothetical protein